MGKAELFAYALGVDAQRARFRPWMEEETARGLCAVYKWASERASKLSERLMRKRELTGYEIYMIQMQLGSLKLVKEGLDSMMRTLGIEKEEVLKLC